MGSLNSSQQIFWDVAGLALLIGGLTVLVRLLRLTPALFWRLIACMVFIGGGTLYWLIATETTQKALGRPFTFGWLLSLGVSEVNAATGGVIVLAALVALGCACLSAFFPHWGVRMLPILGGTASVVLIGFLIAGNTKDIRLWPVVIGTVVFLYLWWLFALLFDLVFVWHRYIRHAVAVKVLREGYQRTTGNPANQ
jgi:hypothetical protein